MRISPLIAAVLLAGCASVGRQIDQNAVAKIKPGKSTKADVRALIGDPNNVSISSGGRETWTYSYSHASAKGENFIPYYGMFAGGMRTQTQSTVVIFSGGVVVDFTTSYGGTEMNTGLAAGGLTRSRTFPPA